MPNPTNTVQRPDLGELAYEYALGASQRGFIGARVMPIFTVMEQSADYPVIPLDTMLKIPEMRRAPRSGYPRGDYEFSTDTYATKEYGWEEPVDDTEAALYRRFFDAESVAVEIAVDHLLRGHEKRVATLVQNTSNAVGNAAVTNEWDDAANATPKQDITTAKESMRAASGLVPNVGVCSKKVFENVLVTNELRTYLQYTSPHLVQGMEAQRQTLARYFGLDDILVGDALEDTAAKGVAASLADVWDDEYFSLMRVSTGGNRLREPVFGRTFLWTADSPGILTTENYREEQTRSEIYRVRHNVDEEIIFTGAHYILTNITA